MDGMTADPLQLPQTGEWEEEWEPDSTVYAYELRRALPLAIVVALVAWLLVAALFLLLGR
jgi:hypothetical protein